MSTSVKVDDHTTPTQQTQGVRFMPTSGAFEAGYVLNERFEIKRLLGQGGFARVFEGVDLNLDRQVAIKVLHGAVIPTKSTDQRVLERFEREAKLTAKVDHPSIVRIYDAGEIEANHAPFIVMEYLHGSSLHAHLEEHGSLPPAKIIPLFIDVLTGLGFAHDAGIVHKDLKPDNIFYKYPDTRREALCIVDFGIAHIGRSRSQRVTRDGEFFGTPSYMPPEYITDQTVSSAIDVYQMALILIECITGQRVVYHEDSIATLMMHLNRRFNIPDALRESAVWPILDRALAEDPKERYRDATRFAEALGAMPIDAWPAPKALLLPARSTPPSLITPNTVPGVPPGEVGLEESSDAALTWREETSPPPPLLQADDASGDEPIDEPLGARPHHKTHVASSPTTNITTPPAAIPTPSADTIRTTTTSPIRYVLLGVLLAVGVGALLASQPEAPPAPERTPPLEEPAARAHVAAEGDAPDQRARSVSAPDMAPPRPAPIEVRVVGDPVGALVFDERGQLVGRTPFTVTFDTEDAASTRYSLSSTGFQPLDIEVSPSSEARTFHYTLEPTAAIEPQAPPSKRPRVKKSGKKTAPRDKSPDNKDKKKTDAILLPKL